MVAQVVEFLHELIISEDELRGITFCYHTGIRQLNSSIAALKQLAIERIFYFLHLQAQSGLRDMRRVRDFGYAFFLRDLQKQGQMLQLHIRFLLP
jgi:hypothetical protein